MKKALITICLISLVVSGCAGTSSSDGERTRQEGTAVGAGAGAAIGALLGQIIGGDTGSTVAGAAIGAGIGGLFGHAYGNHVAQEKAKYAGEEDWLDACIASAEKMNQETRDYNRQLAQQLEALQKETTALHNSKLSKQEKHKALVAKKNEVDNNLKEARQKLNLAKFELENQQQVAQDSTGKRSQELNDEIRQLEKSIAELEEKTTTLASLSASIIV